MNYFITTCLKRSGFAEEISFVGNEARRDHDRKGFWVDGGEGGGGISLNASFCCLTTVLRTL